MGSVMTVDEFLEPSNGNAELRPIIANIARISGPDEGPLSEVERIVEWETFDITRLSSTAEMTPYLSGICEMQLDPPTRALQSTIFEGKQLAHFYLRTLIARVVRALYYAIPSGKPIVTIIIYPRGSNSLHYADNHEPDGIMPEWIVVEGYCNREYAAAITFEDFVKNHTILVVGDTKLVRMFNEDDTDVAADTEACHWSYLERLHYYAKALSTRYAFHLSNKELVVMRFDRDEPAPLQVATQGGERSVTSQTQLQPGLPSDFNTSDPVSSLPTTSQTDKSDVGIASIRSFSFGMPDYEGMNDLTSTQGPSPYKALFLLIMMAYTERQRGLSISI